MTNKPLNDVPEQEEGAESNTEATREFADATAAYAFFEKLRGRLLHVNEWHTIAGSGTAAFQLTDGTGLPVDRSAREGDYFRIDIPGPGTGTGNGYDWVRIERIHDTEKDGMRSLVITVRPATNPTNERQDVAHFFADSATSNFCAMQEGNTVKAAVYGRNEKPNTEAETLLDKARNVAVATGAVAGGAKLQWSRLVHGLIAD